MQHLLFVLDDLSDDQFEVFDFFAFSHFKIIKSSVIHLKFSAYGSWDMLFPISMSPNCKLMSPKHFF